MAKKSELAELTRRIKEIQERLHGISKSTHDANAPPVWPLRLELRVAQAKRDLIRAERRQSKHLLKRAQMKLDLAEGDVKAANTDRLPFPGDSAPAQAN